MSCVENNNPNKISKHRVIQTFDQFRQAIQPFDIDYSDYYHNGISEIPRQEITINNFKRKELNRQYNTYLKLVEQRRQELSTILLKLDLLPRVINQIIMDYDLIQNIDDEFYEFTNIDSQFGTVFEDYSDIDNKFPHIRGSRATGTRPSIFPINFQCLLNNCNYHLCYNRINWIWIVEIPCPGAVKFVMTFTSSSYSQLLKMINDCIRMPQDYMEKMYIYKTESACISFSYRGVT